MRYNTESMKRNEANQLFGFDWENGVGPVEKGVRELDLTNEQREKLHQLFDVAFLGGRQSVIFELHDFLTLTKHKEVDWYVRATNG